MARIYQTRQLFDPSLAEYMEQVIQNRVANESNRNKNLLSSTRTMLSSVGETVDDYIGSYKRQKELQNAEANKDSLPYIEDPMYRAAREEYIRTGNSQPITSYMLQKETAKAIALEEKKAAEEKARTNAFHKSVRLSQARPEYIKIQKAMNDAIDERDYETAEMYKKTLQAYETEFGNVFGDDAATVLEARKKAKEKEAEQKAVDERDARMMAASEALEKQEAEEKKANQGKTALWVETNVIPTIEKKETYEDESGKTQIVSTAQKKKEVKEQLLRLLEANQITEEQANKLNSLVDSIETLEEASDKAVRNTLANNEGDKTDEELAEKRKKKKLAKDGRAAIAAGRKPTRAQQNAIDEGY